MPELDDDLNIKDSNKLQVFGRKVRGALRDVWKEPPTDVFDIGYATSIYTISYQIPDINNSVQFSGRGR